VDFLQDLQPGGDPASEARLQAHLYEMRLFTDEPVLIWKAQLGRLAANAKYIGLMLIPAIVASVPTILILAQLEYLWYLFYAQNWVKIDVFSPATMGLHADRARLRLAPFGRHPDHGNPISAVLHQRDHAGLRKI